MGSKTISVEEETYDRLARAKGNDESFSDVIDRMLVEETHPLYGFVGLLSDDETDRVRTEAESFRRDVEDRLGGNGP